MRAVGRGGSVLQSNGLKANGYLEIVLRDAAASGQKGKIPAAAVGCAPLSAHMLPNRPILTASSPAPKFHHIRHQTQLSLAIIGFDASHFCGWLERHATFAKDVIRLNAQRTWQYTFRYYPNGTRGGWL